MNNDRSNIAFLCVKHHKDAHQALDGRVGGGRRMRIAGMLRDRAVERAVWAFQRRAQGASVAEIAIECGVVDSSVQRWFRKYPEAADSAAFSRLAPFSRGLVKVTVSW